MPKPPPIPFKAKSQAAKQGKPFFTPPQAEKAKSMEGPAPMKAPWEKEAQVTGYTDILSFLGLYKSAGSAAGQTVKKLTNFVLDKAVKTPYKKSPESLTRGFQHTPSKSPAATKAAPASTPTTQGIPVSEHASGRADVNLGRGIREQRRAGGQGLLQKETPAGIKNDALALYQPPQQQLQQLKQISQPKQPSKPKTQEQTKSQAQPQVQQTQPRIPSIMGQASANMPRPEGLLANVQNVKQTQQAPLLNRAKHQWNQMSPVGKGMVAGGAGLGLLGGGIGLGSALSSPDQPQVVVAR